jgi:hypothetical protein
MDVLGKKEKAIEKKLSKQEMVNESVLNSLCVGQYIGFLPVEKIEKKKSSRLWVRGNDLLVLSAMFRRQRVDRQCFLEIAEQATDAWIRCEQSRLNPVNLDLNPSHMFYLPHLRKVWFIYWPVVNNQSPSDIAEFLRRLPMMFSAQPDDGAVNLDDYFALFQRNTPFSAEKIHRVLTGMLGKTAHEKMMLPITSEAADGELNFSPPPRKDVEYDPLLMLHVQQEKSLMLSTSPDMKSLISDVPQGTKEPILSAPCLYRQDTGECIFLTEDVFLIGRDTGSNHYAVLGTGAVSRNHAEIIQNQGRFYLRDKGSKNKTRINGIEIAPDAYVEITPGARILIADTEFIFIDQPYRSDK